MDFAIRKDKTKWKLDIPTSFTEEELRLKSKYEELKKLKQKLHLFEMTGKSNFSVNLKDKAAKIRNSLPKDTIYKKSCDFKKSERKKTEVERSKPVHFFDDMEPRSIHVQGRDLTDRFLQCHFSKHGYIWKIRTNENLTRSVLTFRNPSSARSAVEDLNGKTVEDISLNVSLPKPRNASWCNMDAHSNSISDIINKGISVHLSYKGRITPMDIENFFQTVGKIRRFYLNEMKGFGFVTFETEEQAQRAIKEMNGEFCNGIKILVSPQKFIDRDIKKANSSEAWVDRQVVSYEDLDI